MLTVELEREDINWISKLSANKLTYNSKVNWSIGVTLAFVRRELKIPISLAVPEPALSVYAMHTWVGQLKDRYTKTLS